MTCSALTTTLMLSDTVRSVKRLRLQRHALHCCNQDGYRASCEWMLSASAISIPLAYRVQANEYIVNSLWLTCWATSGVASSDLLSPAYKEIITSPSRRCTMKMVSAGTAWPSLTHIQPRNLRHWCTPCLGSKAAKQDSTPSLLQLPLAQQSTAKLHANIF